MNVATGAPATVVSALVAQVYMWFVHRLPLCDFGAQAIAMVVGLPEDSPVRHNAKWKSCCAKPGIEFPTYSNAQEVSFLFAGIGGPDRAILE
eukprot:669973-Pyramimonas_sp.AAC.1